MSYGAEKEPWKNNSLRNATIFLRFAGIEEARFDDITRSEKYTFQQKKRQTALWEHGGATVACTVAASGV